MSRIMPVVFSILFFSFQNVQAQDQAGRVEVFLALGGHTILNEMQPSAPGMTAYLGGQLIYNLTATQAIGVRYGAAIYEINNALGSEEAWMGDIFATYRYSWRAGKPTRIYIEAGIGAADPVPLYDTGAKFAATAALGVKRFLGERFSLGLESRGVSFVQKESVISTQNVTAAINEFSLVLGYLF